MVTTSILEYTVESYWRQERLHTTANLRDLPIMIQCDEVMMM